MKARFFGFRKVLQEISSRRNEHPEVSSNPVRKEEEFASLVLEMIAHSVIGGIATTMIGSILGFTVFGGLFLDIYSNLTGELPDSDEVTIVTIGPEALYMWNSMEPIPSTTPRDLLAELVQTLDEIGARTIVLDVLLDSPQEGDTKLLSAAQKHGGIIAGEKSQIDQPRTGRLFAKGIHPHFAFVENGIFPAHANLFFTEPILFTGDMIFRGVHHAQFYQRSSIAGKWPDTIVGAREEVISPSLSLAAVWLHRARESDPNIHYSVLQHELQQNCGNDNGIFRCSTSKITGLPDLNVPLHADFWLHHLGSEQNDTLPFVSASQLLMIRAEHAMMAGLGIPEEQLPPTQYPDEVIAKIKDKLVVVGRVDFEDTEHFDRYPTTYSFPFFKKHDMAGVRIQAQIMDALLTGRQLYFVPVWIQIALSILSMWGAVYIFTKKHIRWHIPIWVTYTVSLIAMGELIFLTGEGVVLELGLPIAASIFTFLWLYMRYDWSAIYGVKHFRESSGSIEDNQSENHENDLVDEGLNSPETLKTSEHLPTSEMNWVLPKAPIKKEPPQKDEPIKQELASTTQEEPPVKFSELEPSSTEPDICEHPPSIGEKPNDIH